MDCYIQKKKINIENVSFLENKIDNSIALQSKRSSVFMEENKHLKCVPVSNSSAADDSPNRTLPSTITIQTYKSAAPFAAKKNSINLYASLDPDGA